MDTLLLMTVVFGFGGTPTEIPIGLTTSNFCNQLGKIVAQDVLQTTSAVSVSFTCESVGNA